MDCFNTKSNDIDLTMAVNNKLTKEQKGKIGNLFIDYQKNFKNKLEISAVTSAAAKEIKYPPEYELNFPDEQGGYNAGGDDANLITDFVMIRKRGMTLRGRSLEDVFSPVPDGLFLKAVIKDFEWCFNNVIRGEDEGKCRVPLYAVLKFCRALAFSKEKIIASKKKGVNGQ